MSLHATKTRLALLQAVADGAVSEHYPLLPDPAYSIWDLGPPARHGLVSTRYRKATAGVAEQEKAGWIRLGERDDPSWHKSPRRWEITDAGREVLNGGQS